MLMRRNLCPPVPSGTDLRLKVSWENYFKPCWAIIIVLRLGLGQPSAGGAGPNEGVDRRSYGENSSVYMDR